jgi:Aspartyl protease
MNRSDQMPMTADRHDGHWGGNLNRNPKLYMTGTLTHGFAHDWYEEKLVDLNQPNQIVMRAVATCKPIAQPAQPPMVAANEPSPGAATAPVVTADAPRSTGDDVPFLQIPGEGMVVMAIVGGHSLPMIVDTGASISSIPSALADRLIAEGHAHEGEHGPLTMTMADGSKHDERVVIIDTLSTGNHARSEVPVTVSDGPALLGLPILNAIGRFTVDGQRGVLSFSLNL